MESTTFGFSKLIAWSGTLLFAGMFVFQMTMGVLYLHGLEPWLWLMLPLAIVSIALYAILRWCFIPMLQGRITLELDEEKLQCYLNGTTIYWKDVVEISEKYFGMHSSGIAFEMVDGSDNLNIDTRWMEGSAKSICDKMQVYFAKTL